jgi:hypothetical protein
MKRYLLRAGGILLMLVGLSALVSHYTNSEDWYVSALASDNSGRTRSGLRELVAGVGLFGGIILIGKSSQNQANDTKPNEG